MRIVTKDIVIFAGIMGVAVLFVTIVFHNLWKGSPPGLSAEDAARSAIIKDLLTLFLVFVGLAVAYIRTIAVGMQAENAAKQAETAARQASTAAEGQVTERFSRAIEHLASDQLTVRLGGIYALQRIAKDSERDYETVMEVLASYVREKRVLTLSLSGDAPPNPLPSDIQAILTVLGRNSPPNEEVRKLDLCGTDLREARLENSDLRNTKFGACNLFAADLRKADLRGADLDGAYLENANLRGADLREAKLLITNLCYADLREANLRGLFFSPSTRLVLARLGGADLSGATLFGPDLRGADLHGAKGLTADQLAQAKGNAKTILPEGFEYPVLWLEEGTDETELTGNEDDEPSEFTETEDGGSPDEER